MTVATTLAPERHHPQQRPWLAPVGVVALLGTASAYVGLRDPYANTIAPICPLYGATGLYCPGCGGLRAAHEVLNGDIVAAIGMNPVAVFVIIPGIMIGLAWWIAALASPRVPRPSISTGLAWVLPIFLVAFAIARNIPALAPYLAPGGGLGP